MRRRVAVPLLLVAGVVVAAGLAILHRDVTYYRVTSGSMEPTLTVGARLAIESGVALRPGEIVVFHPPEGAVATTPQCASGEQGLGFAQPCGLATPESPRTVMVKRIVAGPGDLISVRGGQAIVNRAARPEPFAIQCGEGPDCDLPTPVRVPPGQYFLLGDNRGASDDSRFWGPVPASWIVGVAVQCRPLQTACRPLG